MLTGDVTGILAVTDVTENVISEHILQQLSAAGYDFIADVDLIKDSYRILSNHYQDDDTINQWKSYSQWVQYFCGKQVVPRDQVSTERELQRDTIIARLQKEQAYTITFSIMDENREIRTKNLVISAADLRIGRIFLAETLLQGAGDAAAGRGVRLYSGGAAAGSRPGTGGGAAEPSGAHTADAPRSADENQLSP